MGQVRPWHDLPLHPSDATGDDHRMKLGCRDSFATYKALHSAVNLLTESNADVMCK